MLHLIQELKLFPSSQQPTTASDYDRTGTYISVKILQKCTHTKQVWVFASCQKFFFKQKTTAFPHGMNISKALKI